jgi:hypothetical protein
LSSAEEWLPKWMWLAHVADDFILQDKYIKPANRSPLIYNFRHHIQLADQELGKTFCAEA